MTSIPSSPSDRAPSSGGHLATASVDVPDRTTRRVDPWRLVLGLVAILVAAVTAIGQLAGWSGVPLTPTQWLFGLGGLCVLLGGLGLLLRRRR